MKKQSKDTVYKIIDEILAEMSLEDRFSLANIEEEDVDVLQGIFDLYIRRKIDPEDEEYENIMHELWNRVRETHRLRVVK